MEKEVGRLQDMNLGVRYASSAHTIPSFPTNNQYVNPESLHVLQNLCFHLLVHLLFRVAFIAYS